jgi:hypothetical protein
MKNYLLLSTGVFFAFLFLINSCKKEKIEQPPTTGITTSFTEEFENVTGLSNKGWIIKDNSPNGPSGTFASWVQGHSYMDKAGTWSGFTAYSYQASKDEFIYSSVSSGSGSSLYVSSWLLSPVLSVKNGDKISFYVRGDTTATYTNRLQVLLNKSPSSITGETISSTGSFNTTLLDINAAQLPGGFPVNWTKYEYTFTGFAGNTNTRIAFRHYLNNSNNPANGIGIDLFRFQVN